MDTAKTPQVPLPDLSHTFRPSLARALIILGDMVVLSLAVILGVVIWLSRFPRVYERYWQLWPVLAMFILLYAAMGLYSGVMLHPADELRKIVYSTSLVYLGLAATTFLLKEDLAYSRGIFFIAWMLSLGGIPLARSLMRQFLARRSWWGQPVIILGAGATGRLVVESLQRHPQIGLKPAIMLDDDRSKWGAHQGVPIVGGLARIPEVVAALPGAYAIMAMPGISRQRLTALVETYGHLFSHLLLIPDLFGLSSLWVSAREVGGILGLEVRQELLLPFSRFAKRVLDILLTAVCFIPAALLTALFAVLIKLDSSGPVFYWQERIGHNGRLFRVVKFRTMYLDSEVRLARLLEENATLRREYEKYHKLKNDPRITRVGRILRQTSMDELPQIWNVLRGEMSIVGPRAYMPQEQVKMQGKDRTILRVLPGITGIWQVSGRNRLSFEERLDMDVYYVRNWSVWMDIYLLARTVWVVITGEGAY